MDKLLLVLKVLTVSEFRTASCMLSDELLPHISEELYWKCFESIVPTNTRAYLGTFLKAATARYQGRRLAIINASALTAFAQTATPIDCKKLLSAFLPVLRRADEVLFLLQHFSTLRTADIAPYLIKGGTPPNYYTLFCQLKKEEHPEKLLGECICQLMKKGDSISYNMAAILYHYFGCKQENFHFSLQLAPYMLSRLEQGEESFMKVLKS